MPSAARQISVIAPCGFLEKFAMTIWFRWSVVIAIEAIVKYVATAFVSKGLLVATIATLPERLVCRLSV